ncbi:20004_t:CDS:2 [Dentiscutata erythropus]|uniref:20004_t:CDS:1 n=1 Tax=Dentiscutata erythropus TaxID=1348616 RepID=A0A9N9GM24_9GLOM|nr:20004_t:CDS:2 [Dentiscutata erythropus]
MQVYKNLSSTELSDKSSSPLINKPNREFWFALPINEIVDDNNDTQQFFNIIKDKNIQQYTGENIIEVDDNNNINNLLVKL